MKQYFPGVFGDFRWFLFVCLFVWVFLVFFFGGRGEQVGPTISVYNVSQSCLLRVFIEISLAKTQGRQKKRWEDNTESQRAVEDREKWRKLVVKSSVVPRRPSRLRDRRGEVRRYKSELVSTLDLKICQPKRVTLWRTNTSVRQYAFTVLLISKTMQKPDVQTHSKHKCMSVSLVCVCARLCGNVRVCGSKRVCECVCQYLPVCLSVFVCWFIAHFSIALLR